VRIHIIKKDFEFDFFILDFALKFPPYLKNVLTFTPPSVILLMAQKMVPLNASLSILASHPKLPYFPRITVKYFTFRMLHLSQP
jgi:branched-subunit amino acid transport protein